ncbi:hypothetical protein BO99DRAFT_402679 [Aspergillus violaceofuscus CBS 115571]|uniref:Uncharacterized protein n=1 Tax=Aspergillus violaceofuscus (strain CBS 115571) TaxID=1450538 RepID=A0A2V5H5N3_ASPV1|nr:hypothetical protein BO99DRAFT_402679 [Aspergillus violaceofuscus CBS 115571]
MWVACVCFLLLLLLLLLLSSFSFAGLGFWLVVFDMYGCRCMLGLELEAGDDA